MTDDTDRADGPNPNNNPNNIPGNIVKMTQESECPDCKVMNAVPRFEHHKAGTIKCGACGSIYWNTERLACACGTTRFMVLGGLSDGGNLLVSCLGCGHVSDSGDMAEYLRGMEEEATF